jgi:site-specific DNA recombinase
MRHTTSAPRAVAYLRTATREAGTPAKVERQLQACQSHADQLGARLTAVYTDIGVSGSRRRRPGLDRLLRELPCLRARYVIAADGARMARDRRVEAQIVRALADDGVTLVTDESLTDRKGGTQWHDKS